MTPKERVAAALIRDLAVLDAIQINTASVAAIQTSLATAMADAWKEGAASGYNDAVNPLRKRAENPYLEAVDAVAAATAARDAARDAVLSWMHAEGMEGHLRYNDEAPGWKAYLEAEEKLREAVTVRSTGK